jgi:hypothetical protein
MKCVEESEYSSKTPREAIREGDVKRSRSDGEEKTNLCDGSDQVRIGLESGISERGPAD